MRKPVLIGGGLGLLVLALVAGSFWLAGNTSQHSTSVLGNGNRPINSIPQGLESPVVSSFPSASSSERSPTDSQERRQRLAAVRAELNAMRAPGAQATPQKMRALVDELEAISPPGGDPRYFQALRNMLEASSKVQTLSAELQRLSGSNAPKDLDRQAAIRAELRTLGELVQTEARNLQMYSVAQSKVKAP